MGGDFSSPGPPPLSYQSELSSALLTPDKPPPHPLTGQVSCFFFRSSHPSFVTSFSPPVLILSSSSSFVCPQIPASGRLDSTSHGASLAQQSQSLQGNSQLGGGTQLMQRSNPNPRLQADSSFSLVGSADVPEPSLDVRTTENRTLKLFTKLMTKYSTLGFFFFF